MTMTLTYLGDLSRVRIEVDGLSGTEADVERSTDQITWVPVRGGDPVDAPDNEFVLDDYEFAADVESFYRCTGPQTASITPSLAGVVWLKSITRPFLNRAVTVADWSEVTRTARNGVFPVSGRSFPVAVTDLRGSRQVTVQVQTDSLSEAGELDLILASGDPIFWHTPASHPLPTMYAAVGDTAQARISLVSATHRFALPLTEVAAPHHSIVGSTISWLGVINAFATWADVIAAEPTWADLNDRIGDPLDVVVP